MKVAINNPRKENQLLSEVIVLLNYTRVHTGEPESIKILKYEVSDF